MTEKTHPKRNSWFLTLLDVYLCQKNQNDPVINSGDIADQGTLQSH